MRLLAAPDKFRGTASAPDVVDAIEAAAISRGWEVDRCPLADGGEGLLDVFGGANRTSVVRGPLGESVDAGWRFDRRSGTAVIEMARASGLDVVGGAEHNDAMAADTTGTGELIREAVHLGARRIIVGLGGSATTDGGLGALRALEPVQRLRGVELLVACDVRTRFEDAADVFGPQKGASRAQVQMLRRRLGRLAEDYARDHGVEVRDLARSGAAGGLAGGLAAIGGHLSDGFDLVAEEVDLLERIETADLVITGEGHVDAASFEGKVVGGVASLAGAVATPAAVVAGGIDADPAVRAALHACNFASVRSLVEEYGAQRATDDAVNCIEEAVGAVLDAWVPGSS